MTDKAAGEEVPAFSCSFLFSSSSFIFNAFYSSENDKKYCSNINLCLLSGASHSLVFLPSYCLPDMLHSPGSSLPATKMSHLHAVQTALPPDQWPAAPPCHFLLDSLLSSQLRPTAHVLFHTDLAMVLSETLTWGWVSGAAGIQKGSSS